MKPIPLRAEMCATCPWAPGSPHANLRGTIAASACSESIRICHSTGANNAINRRTGKPPAVCAGARKVQLEWAARRRLIAAPTEEAWQAKCDELGIKNGVIYR